MFLSTWYHNEIAITINPNTSSRAIVAKTRTGENADLTVTYDDLVDTGPVKLFVKAETDQYSLGYAVGNADPKYIARLDSQWLQAFVSG